MFRVRGDLRKIDKNWLNTHTHTEYTLIKTHLMRSTNTAGIVLECKCFGKIHIPNRDSGMQEGMKSNRTEWVLRIRRLVDSKQALVSMNFSHVPFVSASHTKNCPFNIQQKRPSRVEFSANAVCHTFSFVFHLFLSVRNLWAFRKLNGHHQPKY